MELFHLIQSTNLDDLKIVVSRGYENVQLNNIFNIKSGDSLLTHAARLGKVEVVRWLHETHGLSVELANFDGKRPLHEASQHGKIACLEYLIDRGAEVDSIKRADWTPLMLACTKPKLDVIRKLTDAGANLNLTNKDGWNPFHIACREGHTDIISHLLNCQEDAWNTVSKNGRTPLHTVALHGKLEALELLLEKCDYTCDTQDSCGTTPLMDAVRSGHLQCADALIKSHGADVFKYDIMGRQCIHLAAQAGCLKAVHYLTTKHGAVVNMSSPQSGVTPLHLACKEGQHDVVRVLLEYKADVNRTDHKGRTALHIASGSQHEQCVQVLLSCGARDLPDARGVHAKDLAIKPSVQALFS